MIHFLTSAAVIKFLSFGNDSHFHSLVSNWILVLVIVAVVCFVVSEITRNYSQVDKLWSLMPAIYGWMTFASYPSPRVLIMTILVTIWGLRLSYNFYRKGGYSIIPWKGEEDYRWQVMRDHPMLKGRFRFGLFNLFFISFYQNIVILLFSSPLLLAAINQEKPLTAIDHAALAFMVLFIITEGLADTQLYRFHLQKSKAVKDNGQFTESLKRGFMSDGLWRYVRHPNFASEQAIWISFYFFGVASSGRLINLTIAGPLLLILLFIGSTQLTERISISKYRDYEDYKKAVPRFLPGLVRTKSERVRV
jgi:steroid 5-alpha reductase family enzyme